MAQLNKLLEGFSFANYLDLPLLTLDGNKLYLFDIEQLITEVKD